MNRADFTFKNAETASTFLKSGPALFIICFNCRDPFQSLRPGISSPDTSRRAPHTMGSSSSQYKDINGSIH